MDAIVFVFSVLIGLLILTFLVVVHELGHAIVARRNGVVVEEFGVGFPPRAWSRQPKKSFLGKNVTYSINWLPIGGFVRLKGEHDEAADKGDYGAASFWAKTKIILAGVVMNWVTAAVLFTVLAFIGMPRVVPDQFHVAADTQVTKSRIVVGDVVKGLPAAAAGLQKGDIVTKIAVTPICPQPTEASCDRPIADEIDSIIALTKANAGSQMQVTYERGGQQRTTLLKNRTVEQAQDGKGYIGVKFTSDSPTTLRSTWSAPVVGVGLTGQLTWETLKGLGGLVGKLAHGVAGQISTNSNERSQASAELGEAGQSVAGPLGIIGQILPGAVSAGIVPVLLISAVMSLTLAVMNVLPIPALDGGRWYTMAAFRLLRRPLTKDLEEKINATGFLVLIGIFILVTIADVAKFF